MILLIQIAVSVGIAAVLVEAIDRRYSKTKRARLVQHPSGVRHWCEDDAA